MKADVIVIGAGASGLLCALQAGRRGRSVLLLDHAPRVGGKIRISGGGRCNFSNLSVSRDHYLSENPHFTASALARYGPSDFMALLDKHGIGHEVRSAGQLFCTASGHQVADLLQAECEGVGARFILDCRVVEVRKGERFVIATDRGVFEGSSLVVATGGLAAPSLGATHFGYTIARQFGLRVTALRPALTPLRLSHTDTDRFATLSGISFEALVQYGKARFHGSVLFTHRGLSGPSILQISSYWDGKGPVVIDLLPGIDIRALFTEHSESRAQASTLLSRYLPARLARLWCDPHLKSMPLSRLTSRQIDALAEGLHHWEVTPAGTEGFNRAEVTRGGVSTSELSSKTMEARRVAGLYFTGEVIDVTGHLGGYNLHWAWASGHAAGQVA